MNSYNNYTQDIPTSMEATEYFNAKGVAGCDIPLAWHAEMKERNWKDSAGRKIMHWKKYANRRIEDVRAGKIHSKASQTQSPNNSVKKEGLALFAQEVSKLQQQNAGFGEIGFEKVLFKQLAELKQELKATDEDIKQLCYKRWDSLTGDQFLIYNFLQALK